jgi:hypothetical protein
MMPAIAYLVLSCNSRFAFTTCEDQDLIYGMHLIPNVTSNWNLHRDKLAEQSRMHNLPELPERSYF